MYLYNVSLGVRQFSYTFHIANFAEVSTDEMVLYGQKVLEIMCADGLCLVLPSYCTVSPKEQCCTARTANRRKLLRFPSFSMKGQAL